MTVRKHPLHYITRKGTGQFGLFSETACKNNDALFAVDTIAQFKLEAVRCKRCEASKTTAFHWRKYKETHPDAKEVPNT